MDPRHQDRGNSYERTTWNSLERAFAELWEHESKILGMLIGKRPTREQRYAAATVIQWLGSNVGFSFFQRALAKGGYKVVGGEPNRDNFTSWKEDPLLIEMERAHWEEYCDKYLSNLQSEVQQTLFDESEPH